MIQRILWMILAFFFPWLVLLLKDNPGGALLAIIMQATLIGWIPATVWAWRTVYPKINQNSKNNNPPSKHESNVVKK